jgi:hypothetical protein
MHYARALRTEHSRGATIADGLRNIVATQARACFRDQLTEVQGPRPAHWQHQKLGAATAAEDLALTVRQSRNITSLDAGENKEVTEPIRQPDPVEGVPDVALGNVQIITIWKFNTGPRRRGRQVSMRRLTEPDVREPGIKDEAQSVALLANKENSDGMFSQTTKLANSGIHKGTNKSSVGWLVSNECGIAVGLLQAEVIFLGNSLTVRKQNPGLPLLPITKILALQNQTRVGRARPGGRDGGFTLNKRRTRAYVLGNRSAVAGLAVAELLKGSSKSEVARRRPYRTVDIRKAI